MFRFTASALLLAVIVAAAGCDSTPPEATLVSQALAAPASTPANTPDKGWQSSVSPTAVDDTVSEYE
jgi:hypothetical protein